MKEYQKEFIDYCIKNKILNFGSYNLKSGRKSPYFFNAGLFNSGNSLSFLGEVYAKTLIDSKLDFDIIFGPAYKGVPIACATVIAMNTLFNKDISWCFNRKEVKDHGEGGQLVGDSIAQKKIALIDDVITAGTAIGEVSKIINHNSGIISFVCIALNRQECATGSNISAVKKVESKLGAPVISIISLDDIIKFMIEDPKLLEYAQEVQTYRQKYGEKSLHS